MKIVANSSQAETRAPICLVSTAYDSEEVAEVQDMIEIMMRFVRIENDEKLQTLMNDILVSCCVLGQAYQVTGEGQYDARLFDRPVFSLAGIYRILLTVDLNVGPKYHLEAVETCIQIDRDAILPFLNENLISALKFFGETWPSYRKDLKHTALRTLHDKLIGFSAGADHCVLQ
jgi:hypothetical protein